MAAIVSLWSSKTGEIKRFLDRYCEKDMHIGDDVKQWIHVYNNPLDAIDIISVVIENDEIYQLSLCIQVDSGDLYRVTRENHNDIIKGLLYVFYEEHESVLC